MTKIFLSYASHDRIVVESLSLQLKAAQHDVWMDVTNIRGGSEWEKEIIMALEQTEVCVLVITEKSVESTWVKREIEIARNLNKTVIPIIMYDLPTIAILDTFSISDLQTIDFHRYGFTAGLDKLLHALDKSVDSHSPSLKALIIEDMKEQQQTIETVLKSLNIDCTIAGDYDIAFDLIRSETYDLVTLDMQLGEMDIGGQHGMLLLDQLKTINSNAKIIIISALDWTEEQIRDFLKKYGADDYIKKPFTLVELHERVRGIITNE